MPFDLIIRGGSVVRPEGAGTGDALDIAVEGGLIVEVAPEISGAAKREFDARGMVVMPGVIDAHVHFNEPGREEWEGITTGSSALVAGGGTTFFDMPLNSDPPVLSGKEFDAKLALLQAKSYADFGIWGGLTPENIEHLEELAERGVIGFKAFMSGSGIAEFGRANEATLEAGMRVAAKLGKIVAVHAEDEELTTRLTAEARARGETSMAAYLATRPIEAEVKAIRDAIALAKATGCRLHIVHVSSAAGVDEVTAGKRAGADVTCETCPHYLVLETKRAEEIGARAKCAPPIRNVKEVRKLWHRLAAAEIDTIGSDHSPAPESMKQSSDMFENWGGIAGVQATLTVLLDRDMEKHCGGAHAVARLTGQNVAKRFGLVRKGAIVVGNDADVTLVDLSQRYVLSRDTLMDRHRLSPYVGRNVRARIVETVLRGETVFKDGTVVGKPRGERAEQMPTVSGT